MRRSTRTEWAKRVERWHDSGLTSKEFAAEVGVNPRTLEYWKYKLRSEAQRASESAPPGDEGERRAAADTDVGFVELNEATTAPGAATGGAYEVVLPSGVMVRVQPEFDAASLRRLIETLARC